jgi:hypothetical protein
MSRLLVAVAGQEKLRTVFWGYCVVGTFVMGALLFAVFRVLMLWDSSPLHTVSGWATGALFVTYFLWAHVSLWACAFNAERRGWGYAARCYAVVVVIHYLVGLFDNPESGSPIGIRQVLSPSAYNALH